MKTILKCIQKRIIIKNNNFNYRFIYVVPYTDYKAVCFYNDNSNCNISGVKFFYDMKNQSEQIDFISCKTFLHI